MSKKKAFQFDRDYVEEKQLIHTPLVCFPQQRNCDASFWLTLISWRNHSFQHKTKTQNEIRSIEKAAAITTI